MAGPTGFSGRGSGGASMVAPPAFGCVRSFDRTGLTSACSNPPTNDYKETAPPGGEAFSLWRVRPDSQDEAAAALLWSRHLRSAASGHSTGLASLLPVRIRRHLIIKKLPHLAVRHFLYGGSDRILR